MTDQEILEAKQAYAAFEAEIAKLGTTFVPARLYKAINVKAFRQLAELDRCG